MSEHEDHQQHHQGMIADFRRRLWVSLALIVPILLLSHLIQGFLGLTDLLAFPADDYGLLALSTAVFLHGGWPFLTELVSELRDGAPGMMTLIPLAAGAAYGVGVVLSPAVGAALMSLSTVIVAINAKLLGRFQSSAA